MLRQVFVTAHLSHIRRNPGWSYDKQLLNHRCSPILSIASLINKHVVVVVLLVVVVVRNLMILVSSQSAKVEIQKASWSNP